MKKYISYIFISLILMLGLYLLLLKNGSRDEAIAILSYFALIGITIILIICQLIMGIFYLSKKKQEFNFLYVLSFVFSLGYSLVYAAGVLKMMKAQNFADSIQKDFEKQFEQVTVENIDYGNPFFGEHFVFLVPVFLQLVIVLLRYHKHKSARIEKVL